MYIFVSDIDISIRKLRAYGMDPKNNTCLWLNTRNGYLYSRVTGSKYRWFLWLDETYFNNLMGLDYVLKVGPMARPLDIVRLRHIMGAG